MGEADRNAGEPLPRSWQKIGVLIVGAAFVFLSTSCTRISERFEDASAAEREGFFERGWLPDVLPRSAGPIVDLHDLDTNARCSRSVFPTLAGQEVEDALRRKGFSDYSGALPRLPFRGCPFSLEAAHKADIVLAMADFRERQVAAINYSTGTLLFWAGHPNTLRFD